MDLHICMASIWVGVPGRVALGLFDERSLLDMGLESSRAHLMYLSQGTVTFGFSTILHLRYFNLLSEK